MTTTTHEERMAKFGSALKHIRATADRRPAWHLRLVGWIEAGGTPLGFAKATGRPRSTVYGPLLDPDYSRTRARKGTFTCPGCGGKFQADGDRRDEHRWCHSCRVEKRRKEGRARYISEIHRWVQLYGKPPTAMDWNLQTMRDSRRSVRSERLEEAERRHREEGPWPSTSGVQNLFGSWNAALEAAGIETVEPGIRRDGYHMPS